jgi:hypothetical protein
LNQLLMLVLALMVIWDFQRRQWQLKACDAA